jgi:hypothetical protein
MLERCQPSENDINGYVVPVEEQLFYEKVSDSDGR